MKRDKGTNDVKPSRNEIPRKGLARKRGRPSAGSVLQRALDELRTSRAEVRAQEAEVVGRLNRVLGPFGYRVRPRAGARAS
jgi:hypothetical protein